MPVRGPSTITLVASLLVAGSPAPAGADLTICNQTSEPAGIAIALVNNDKWKSEGWWTIDPGRCKAVLKGRLADEDYFLHGRHYNVGGRWEGDAAFCIDRGSFSIEGRRNCEMRGFETSGFLKIETEGKPDWQHTLTDDARTSTHGAVIEHNDLPQDKAEEQSGEHHEVEGE